MKHDEAVLEAMQLLEMQSRDWGLSLTSSQLQLMRQYAELIASYDAANVIGSRDLRTIVLDHVADSLSCIEAGIELRGRLIDVGAGAGLPGVPLAIAHLHMDVTLLEATEKKAKFLRHAEEVLGVLNLNVLNMRAEDAGMSKDLRDTFDLAVARALSSLPVVLEYCAPFVKPGGSILSMKGRIDEDEIAAGRRAAARLGAELREVTRVDLREDFEQKHRHIVVFRKVAPTPSGYPRRVGLAKKRPLGG